MTGSTEDLAAEGLTITTDDRDAATVVTLSGELDLMSAGAARAAIERPLIDGATALVVDLTPLDFIDSSGLGVLVRTHKKARVLRTPFAVVCPPGTAHRLLSITGLLQALRVHETRAEALASLEE
ncbi:STAS domain-containing protein [Nocardioides sp. YIM 152588]|uniref:STAS domain-containing protein n=1 Tax=Nocardioides sp. YIM 152588 TaxID=3158259 RepID=UPI0032E3FB06